MTHNSFSYMFISILYMFRAAMCPSSWELIVLIRHLLYVSLCIDDLFVCRFGLDCSLIQTCCPKHVENRNKHTWKRTVRQVGYLQRLYRDSRSTERKIDWIYCLLQKFKHIMQCTLCIYTHRTVRLRVYEFYISVVGKTGFTNKNCFCHIFGQTYFIKNSTT